MPIAHIDVLITRAAGRAAVLAYGTVQACRQALAEAVIPPATVAELRARSPGLVAVFGDGPATAIVAAHVHEAGLPLVLLPMSRWCGPRHRSTAGN